MALSTRVWGAGKRVLLGGALVLTYFVFAAAAMRLAIKTRDVDRPAADGQERRRRPARCSPPAGLNLKVEEARRVDAAVPAGTIVSQDPQPGVKTRRERSVKVWVSAGPRGDDRCRRCSASPSGPRSCARSRTACSSRPIAEIRSSDYTAGTVVAQNPPPQNAMPAADA